MQKSDEEATAGYILSEVIPKEGKTNRGIIKELNNYVQDIIETFEIEHSTLEQKDLHKNSLCSMNIFAFHPQAVFLLSEKLEAFKKENGGNRKIECLLPNEIGNLIKNKKIKMKLYKTDDKWMGVTNPGDENMVRQFIEKNNLSIQ